MRYSSPTSTRKRRRSLISFRIRWAISICLSLSWPDSEENQSRAGRIARTETSEMFLPAIFTASASGFRRAPPQTSHGVSDW